MEEGQLYKRDTYVDFQGGCIGSDCGALLSGNGKTWRTLGGIACKHARMNDEGCNEATIYEYFGRCEIFVLKRGHGRRT